MSIRVCMKPTHTHYYLHWDSYHNMAAKYSTINTPMPKAQVVCFTAALLRTERKICSAKNAFTQPGP